MHHVLSISAIVTSIVFVPFKSPAQTRDDTAYTAKIREFTTEKFFLTDLIDHLPASSTVPSPLKALGYISGDNQRLTYSQDLHKYYRELAKASKRIKVFVAPEKTEEGKEQLLVVISDETNLAKLDHYKGATARLADPRHLSDDESRAVIAEAKPFYWVSGSIHSTETGSPEMLMELAYRLAVEETPFYETIRKNSFVMITPVLEVDGINNNFGELLPASIAGFVYVDANNDGVKQNTEAPISGVTVKLTGTDVNGASVSLTTTTAADGSYAFLNLVPNTAPNGAIKADDLKSIYARANGAQFATDALIAANRDYSAAFQIAVWEINHDFDGTLGSLSTSAGLFQVFGNSSFTNPLSAGITAILTDLFSHAADNISYASLSAMTDPVNQDLLVDKNYATFVVPEPGTYAMAVSSGLVFTLFCVRRRRSVRQ